MQCPLCGAYKTHKHGKTQKGTQRYFCPSCKQTFTDSFDTIYYRRKISPEKIETVLQAHAEGSSLRGISRTTKLAYNTVIGVVRYAATKAQMIHNEEVIEVETETITGDEFWSYVKKTKKLRSRRNKSR